jgi:hypothetical protein
MGTDSNPGVGFLTVRLECTDVGDVATVVWNLDVGDRTGDRSDRLTDDEDVLDAVAAFLSTWRRRCR